MFEYTFDECTEMEFTGKLGIMVELHNVMYHERFPHHVTPSQTTFVRIKHRLREIGTF